MHANLVVDLFIAGRAEEKKQKQAQK